MARCFAQITGTDARIPSRQIGKGATQASVRPVHHVMFINVFESGAVADAYFAWRKKTGAIEQLENLLEGTPEIELWPLCSGYTWVDNELLIK